ncbi:ubiquitin related modifier 1 [Tuber magnatum]|uniref:Ubiquitin-related modifier 1 n=1 Tax=Tuber magnatum TaxID=42249 RepID=A0A317T0W2_9PEZI|nr:ubiquitin related modifier 1 [Tuber magnatum]
MGEQQGSSPNGVHYKPVTLDVEFSGGLETLFSNQRSHRIQIPAKDPSEQPANLGFLVHYLCENLMKDKRKELFVLEDRIRPGILVLINDVDWELEGEEGYLIQDDDTILFVSTLHGG